MIKVGIKTKAFTLIELLLVIAIVAILATIAIPSYNKYIRTAKLTILSKNGVVSKELCTALESYYVDNNKYGDDGTYEIKWTNDGEILKDNITTWLHVSKYKYINIKLTISSNGQDFSYQLYPTPGSKYDGLDNVSITKSECN